MAHINSHRMNERQSRLISLLSSLDVLQCLSCPFMSLDHSSNAGWRIKHSWIEICERVRIWGQTVPLNQRSKRSVHSPIIETERPCEPINISRQSSIATDISLYAKLARDEQKDSRKFSYTIIYAPSTRNARQLQSRDSPNFIRRTICAKIFDL